ncbi:MAG: GNAT family N-acetyltransferase [Bacteroidetes bacterium 46-16]|nr:MAG: GNAT family N-acetyltransferase [Bacteroidetes bacterium 46-16]
MQIQWIIKEFKELELEELYGLLQLRERVFEIEQNCVYPDLDDKDQTAVHIMGYGDDKMIAYSRLLPQGISYEDMSIGRVVTHISYRRFGIGKELMTVSIEACYKYFGKAPIRISAQLYLKAFYKGFDFVAVSEPYMEDNIPHIEMLKD